MHSASWAARNRKNCFEKKPFTRTARAVSVQQLVTVWYYGIAHTLQNRYLLESTSYQPQSYIFITIMKFANIIFLAPLGDVKTCPASAAERQLRALGADSSTHPSSFSPKQEGGRQLSRAADLSGDNAGCHTLTTEDECLMSKDGRTSESFSGSPCAWCCDNVCTSERAVGGFNKCEPSSWLPDRL